MIYDSLAQFFFGVPSTGDNYHLVLPTRFLCSPHRHHVLRSSPEAVAISMEVARLASSPLDPAKEEHIRGWMAWSDCDALNPILDLFYTLAVPPRIDKDSHYYIAKQDAAGAFNFVSTGVTSPRFALALGLGPNALTHRILSLYRNPRIEVQFTAERNSAAAHENTTLHDEIRLDGVRPLGGTNGRAVYDEATEDTLHCAIIARCPTVAGGCLFICAGETANGTQFAASHLARKWTSLANEMFELRKTAEEWQDLGQYWIFRYREHGSGFGDKPPIASMLDCGLFEVRSHWTQDELTIPGLQTRTT